MELVKARHAGLQKARAERLAAVTAEPDQVRLGEVHFIAHALIVPSVEEEDAKRFDAEVEAVAVKLATAHEENLGAKVRDVSNAARARAAGLSEFPGFDLLADHPKNERRCIEVKGRADRGEVFMTDNEWARAANLRDQYWLYVVFNCATPNPELLRVRDPFARLTGTVKGGLTLKVGDLVAMAERDRA